MRVMKEKKPIRENVAELFRKAMACCVSATLAFSLLPAAAVADEVNLAAGDVVSALADGHESSGNVSIDVIAGAGGETAAGESAQPGQDVAELVASPGDVRDITYEKPETPPACDVIAPVGPRSAKRNVEMDTSIALPNNSIELSIDGDFDPDKYGYAYRLLVGMKDGVAPFAEDAVLSKYGNAYLLGFDTASELQEAKAKYEPVTEYASYDMPLSASAGESAPDMEDLSKIDEEACVKAGESSLDELAHEDKVGMDVGGKPLVAMLDTGYAKGCSEVASVLGDDGLDRNGHAARVLTAIKSEDADAKVLSVKVLDDTGKGTVASVYAGITYAANSGAKVMNLSFSARAASGCEAIAAAIDHAVAKGCTVVVSAGNDGADVSGYCPANVGSAVTVGACDAAGKALATSNRGVGVDAWVEAMTTSLAAARYTGRLSSVGSAEDIASHEVQASDSGSVREEIEADAAKEAEASFEPDASHATVNLSAVYTQNGSANNGTARGSFSTGGGSVTAPTNYHFKSLSASLSNSPGGSVAAAVNTSDGWPFQARISTWSGNVASAYTIQYQVHGQYKSAAAGTRVSYPNWATHENAALDGFWGILVVRQYAHTVRLRYQNADGTWSGYSNARSGNYGYLSTVPAYSRGADARYKAASMSAYTASYAAKTTSLDVYRQSYTASFNGNGGTDGASITKLTEAPLGTLPESSRPGYDFAGWWTDPTGGTQVTSATTMPLANTTYYAHWTPHTYGIEYAGMEGADNIENFPSGGDYDSDVTIPNPTKTGYTFTGWTIAGMDSTTHVIDGVETNAEAISAKTFATAYRNLRQEAGTVTFTAHWTPNTYTLAYTGMTGASFGASHPSKATYDVNVSVSNPAKLGYNFAGWNITNMDATPHVFGNSTSSATTASRVKAETMKNLRSTSGEVRLAAQWTPVTYSIAYGGMENASFGANHPITGTYDVNVSIDNPTRTGYTFAGWTIAGMDGVSHTIGSETTSATSIDAETFATTYKNLRSTPGTVTFTATWRANTYHVVYHANGGTGEMDVQEFTYDAPQALNQNAFANDANKPFYGWATSAGGPLAYSNGQVVSNLTSQPDGVFDLYARYAGSERAEDTVIVTHANDNTGRAGEVVYRNDFASSANIDADGTRNGGYLSGIETVQNYAYPNAEKVRVTAKYQTENADSSWLAVYGQGAAPTMGNADASATGKLGGPVQATGDFDIEGKEAKAYFNSGAGGDWYGYRLWMRGCVEGSEQPYSSVGGDFAGWNTRADGTGASYPSVYEYMKGLQPGESAELYAMWDLHGRLYYDANGGSGNMPAQEPEEGSTGVEAGECSFTYPGYSFAGWNTRADGTGDTYYPGDFVETGEGMVLFAMWEPDNLMFSCTTSKALVLRADGSIVSATPEKASLVNGSDLGLKVKGIKASAPERMSLVSEPAAFAEYSLKATPDGGAAQDLAKCQYGGFVAPDNLNDWLIGPGSSIGVSIEGEMPAIDIVRAGGEPFGEIGWLVGVQSGVVGFEANGGTGELNQQTVSLGGALVMPSGAGLSKRYCEFAGWALNPDGTGDVYMPGDTVFVEGDATFYAVWDNVLGFDVDNLSWASSTENVLARALDAHYNPSIDFDITDYIHAGDIRNVNLSTMRAASGFEKHASQQVQLMVVDTTGKYDLADGSAKAALVVQQVSALASGTTLEGGPIDPDGSASAWAGAPRASWLDATYKQALPASLRNLVKQVNVASYDGSAISDARSFVFLPAEREVLGSLGSLGEASSGLSQWEYFAQGGDVVKKAGARGATCSWWLRSAGDEAGEFRCVTATGATASSAGSDALGIAPCFCL